MDHTKARILFVDDVPEIVDACARLLGREHEVVTATNPEDALEICRATEEPFAVVVSDDEMPGMRGTRLLARIREESPLTVRLMLTGLTELDVAVGALNEGQVFRFLTKPFTHDELRAAVREGVEHHHSLVSQSRATEVLLSSNATLQDSNEVLEERVARQTAVIHRLRQFADELSLATSLEDIARMAAEVASDALDERGVHVQIWDPDATGIGVEAGAGPEMSSRMHRQPLITPEGQIGEIVVDHLGPRGEELREAHHSVLVSIASSTVVAVRTEFRCRERDQAQQATITALARLAEQRDNETGKHLERVSLYSKLLAEGLREQGLHRDLITDGWLEDLVHSSPLHDIGKVGIPDSILLKPGKLTPEEWVIMKTHAEIGAATIDSVIRENCEQSFLRMARDIAWCHHEKWDGSGYPRGLKAEEIPLSARILALADVYDALTTVRPYKAAWSHDDALEWIQSYSGSHFDPHLVDVLVERERVADRIRVRLADHVEDMV